MQYVELNYRSNDFHKCETELDFTNKKTRKRSGHIYDYTNQFMMAALEKEELYIWNRLTDTLIVTIIIDNKMHRCRNN